MADDDDESEGVKARRHARRAPGRAAAPASRSDAPGPVPGKASATESLPPGPNRPPTRVEVMPPSPRAAQGLVVGGEVMGARTYEAQRQAVAASQGTFEAHGGPPLDADQGRVQFRRALAYYHSRDTHPEAMRGWRYIVSQYHAAIHDLLELHMSGVVKGLSRSQRAELSDMMRLRPQLDAETKERLGREGATPENLAAVKDAPRSRAAARSKGLSNRDAQHRQGDALHRSRYLVTTLPGGHNGLLGFVIGDRGTNQQVQARLEQVIAEVMRGSRSELPTRRGEALAGARQKSATTPALPGMDRLAEAEARLSAEREAVAGAPKPSGKQAMSGTPSARPAVTGPPPQRARPPLVPFGAGAALLVVDFLNWYASLDGSEIVHALRTYRSQLFARMGGPAYETTYGTIWLPPTGAALTTWFDAHIHSWKDFHQFWNFDARNILVQRDGAWGLVVGSDREGHLVFQPVDAEIETLFARLDHKEEQDIGETVKLGSRVVRFRSELAPADRAVWYSDGGLLPRLLMPLAEGRLLGASARFLVVGERTSVRAGGIGKFYEVRGGDVRTAKVMQGRTGLLQDEDVEDAS